MEKYTEDNWPIDFISYEDFFTHVSNTISQYGKMLMPYDLEMFNKNLIDPVKMVFDKAVYNETWDELIHAETFRQRDKAGNNYIGYFHQRIFSYIKNCHVPDNGKEGGWDVIYKPEKPYRIDEMNFAKTIFVEMKNKHNTMNSSSASATYIKMQDQLLNDDTCACFLVEAIAKEHQNIEWETTVKKNGINQQVHHKRIRRVSIDEFYAITTGETNAFYQVCMALPYVVNQVVASKQSFVPEDKVIAQLKERATHYNMPTEDLSILMALYMLGFSTYNGFKEKTNK